MLARVIARLEQRLGSPVDLGGGYSAVADQHQHGPARAPAASIELVLQTSV
jgi:hypothetical protein